LNFLSNHYQINQVQFHKLFFNKKVTIAVISNTAVGTENSPNIIQCRVTGQLSLSEKERQIAAKPWLRQAVT